MARGVDKKSAPTNGASVTGVAAVATTHAVFQANGCAPVPSAAGSAQSAWGVLGTGMNPDLRVLGVEAV